MVLCDAIVSPEHRENSAREHIRARERQSACFRHSLINLPVTMATAATSTTGILRGPAGWNVCECTYVCIRVLRVCFAFEVCIFLSFQNVLCGPNKANIRKHSHNVCDSYRVNIHTLLMSAGAMETTWTNVFLYWHFMIESVLNLELAMNQPSFAHDCCEQIVVQAHNLQCEEGALIC